ncbi:MAG: DUF4255 domain-containing protein [Caldilinea sp. CFX5]|nr:DUF4255 domain-containing protein [Caldilinea sp. CFX5]
MIQDLDRTLQQLLRDGVPLVDQIISFAVPDDHFRATLSQLTGVAVNLYLYDLRENHDLRSPEWPVVRQPDGRLIKQRPKVRMDFFYMVTVWSTATTADVVEEHTWLGRILRTLLRYPTIPAELLQGSLIGQEAPLPTLVAQPDGMRNPAEFWGALRQPPRPAIQLVVTVAVDPTAATDEPWALTPVVARTFGVGLRGGLLYRLDVRPALFQGYAQGTRLRRLGLTPAPIAHLAAPVFASPHRLQIQQVQPLVANEWVLIDDGDASEFVRLGEIVGDEPTVTVTVTPPLQFAHDPTADPIPIRRVTTPESDPIVTRLVAATATAAQTVRVTASDNVAVDTVLLLADGEQSEVVIVQEIREKTVNEMTLAVRPALRFPHRAQRNLFKRTLAARPPDPAGQTRLAQPAAQPGATMVLDSPVVADTLVMVGVGPDVEFCRLQAATAGQPVPVTPPLRNNHGQGSALRQVTPADVIGWLELAAAPAAQELRLVGELAAEEAARRRQRALVSAGELVLLDHAEQSAAVQITAVTARPGAIRGAAETFFTIGGWVCEEAAPAQPIAGARVILSEKKAAATVDRLQAATDADGRFTFVNLAAGPYLLQVVAPGYQALEKEVQVPAASQADYRIGLKP